MKAKIVPFAPRPRLMPAPQLSPTLAEAARSPLEQKAGALQARRPDLAAVIEELLDGYLDDCDGAR